MSGEPLAASEVEALFRESGALLDGHFLLSSGKHAPRYLQAARVLAWPLHAERLGGALGKRLAGRGIELVVSPALGGVVIGHEVARALGIPHFFCEKETDGSFALRRGFELKPGARVAVVEDVLTTRGSASRASELVVRLGGTVVAVAAIADRGPGGAPLPCEPTVLWQLEVPSYPAAGCPECRAGGPPPVKPGSRTPGAERTAGD